MKKKNYKGRILGFLIITFITTNAFLIYFDDNGIVDRKSYIKEWSQSITYDLYEKIKTSGVMASEKSNPVYFDEEVGSFQKFLIEEGDAIDEGDDLYSYEVADYQSQKFQLESEVAKWEDEADAIDNHIDELEDYDIPEPDSGDSNSSNDSDDESEEEPPSYIETEFMQENAIAEQETKLAKAEAIVKMKEEQLDDLESTGQEITVTSPFAGTVTDISESLESPLITLASTNLHLEGELSETERSLIEKEMKARIYVPDLDMNLSGSLTSLREFPNEVDVHRSSIYPYEIAIDEADKRLLPGYHADVEIITEQATDVVTASEDVLISDKNLYAWVMDNEGRLERRAIETGLEENGLVEVTEGLKPGEWLASLPKDEFRDEATFITPIKRRDFYIEHLFEFDTPKKKTYALLGLLTR